MRNIRGLGLPSRLALALVVGGAVFGIASVVQADIPDGGVIQSCYQKNSGQLRVVDTDKSAGGACNPSESPLTWNQTGPKGSTGAKGETGSRGPTGLTGPAGTGIGAGCTANHAIQSVNGDGSVNCVAFTPSGRVLTTGQVPVAASASRTLLDVKGVQVVGVCTAQGQNGVHAQISMQNSGGSFFVEFASDSSSVGHVWEALRNGHSSTIADEASDGIDRVSFNAIGDAGFTLDGTAFVEADLDHCVFTASGIAANGPAPPAGQ